ncbi:MAG: IS1595 family transposase [Gammaproteobacteria bacterium]|nr:IS1595 family transposase [Gammaproteobacteria bacterium]
MTQKAPGKSHRKGITLIELANLFPSEDSARKWYARLNTLARHRALPLCNSENTHECSHVKMPYRCRKCRKYFSVKTGTVMAGSPLPLLKWVYAIYLDLTSLKGVSSMKLHRDLGITQKTAWHMQQRIREAFASEGSNVMFNGPAEADETYVGGRESNKHEGKKLRAGRGTVGKTAVAGIKDRESNQIRAKVVARTDAETLQGFVVKSVSQDAQIYTDEATAYQGLPFPHKTVKHSVGEFVDGMAHTNGIESFWALMKRGYHGTYHKMSPKHLNRYVAEFSGRHNLRDLDTISQMEIVASGLTGKSLSYEDLIADNGFDSGART